MGIEKRGSKGGNYVGGLLHLFDWNAKSRKKLFANKADLPEKPKQKKRYDGNLTTSQLHMLDEHEFAAGSSMKEFSDHSYASSLTDDDFYTSKAPSVVARLMGLDSLPNSNILEPNSIPLSDCQSFTSSRSKSEHLEYFQDREPKYREVAGRPIKKFQTEIFPPKSAKSVPITRHKLLSPIKGSSFVPRKDAAHIMEAAARIIEPCDKTNMPLARSSSSLPSKVRGSKEKVQAVKKPSKNEGNESSFGTKNEGRTISLALQAKANVRKREGLNLKEEDELNQSRGFTSRQAAQTSTLKRPSTQKCTNVLRQNDRKQNCTVDSKRPLPPSKSGLHCGQKALNGDFSSKRQRNSSKLVGPTKVENDTKRLPARVGRKKRSIDDHYHLEKKQDAHSLPKGKNGSVVGSVGSAESGKNRKTIEHDVKGGDTLRSTFLEHKLNETTRKMEFSLKESGTVYLMQSNVIEENKSKKDRNYADNTAGEQGSSLYSLRGPKGSITSRKCQGLLEEIGISGNTFSERTMLECRLPTPVSVLEHFAIAESCNSSDTAGSNSTEGGKHCSSARYSTNTFLTFEGDANSSHSASSTSTVTRRDETTLTSPYSKKPRNRELDYIKELLSTIEPMFNDYASYKTRQIIKPHLFDRLESRKGHSDTREGIITRMNRKLIFDCVNECLDLRFRHYVNGGYELWAKGLWMAKRKDRLAEDVYKNISGWSTMGHFMVDEIVENDMSSKNGTWLDYDVETFELGMKIESRILSSLIDEVVDDVLVL